MSGQVEGQRLSVCMVTGEYPPAIGGVADYTSLLVDHLEAMGARVAIVEEETFAKPDARWTPHVIARVVRDERADIVHLQYQTAAFGMSGVINVLPLLLRQRGVRCPFITTFHDLRVPYLFPKAGALRRLAVHALIGASDGAIFTDAADIVRAHPRREAAWIPMAPTLSPQAPPPKHTARAALGIEPDELVLAHFGFLNASKGLHTLLRAAERLSRARVPIRLLFVGDETGASDPTNSAVAERVWQHADALGLGDVLIRAGGGMQADVSAKLSAADIAVLPFTDGASLRRSSLLACWAHGLPVVTTRPRSEPPVPVSQAIEPFTDPEAYRIDEKVAVLVAVGDDAALAREIYRLADEPERMQQLGEGGRALAGRLSWPSVAAATLSFYRRLLDPGCREQ